jgi:hypothetical protein
MVLRWYSSHNGQAPFLRMSILLKSIRTIGWRRANLTFAFISDLRRLNRLAVISDERCQFYGWDAYYCWRTIGELDFATGISSRLTVAPFSLSHGIYCLTESLNGPVCPNLVRRIVSELMSKSEDEFSDLKSTHQLCKLALLVTCYSEGSLTKDAYIQRLNEIPILSTVIADTMVVVIRVQFDELGVKHAKALGMSIKNRYANSCPNGVRLKRQDILDGLIKGIKL